MSVSKWDKRFLQIAQMVSTWSKDPSTQCGAVIVRPNKTICSVGFNGFPQAMPDNPLWYSNREEKYSRIVHCEKNALIFAGENVKGYTLYTYPFCSCDRCIVEMAQAGITRFVCPEPSQDILSRWHDSIMKTRQYVAEMDLKLLEVPWEW